MVPSNLPAPARSASRPFENSDGRAAVIRAWTFAENVAVSRPAPPGARANPWTRMLPVIGSISSDVALTSFTVAVSTAPSPETLMVSPGSSCGEKLPAQHATGLTPAEPSGATSVSAVPITVAPRSASTARCAPGVYPLSSRVADPGIVATTWLPLTAAPAGEPSAAAAVIAAAAEMTARVRLRAARAPEKQLDIRLSPSRGRGVNPARTLDQSAIRSQCRSGRPPHRLPAPRCRPTGGQAAARTGRFAGARRVARCHGPADRHRYDELGGPGVRRGVVSAGPPRPRAPALVRRALRGGRGQRDVLRRAGREDRRALGPADPRRLHVRRQAPPPAQPPRGRPQVAAAGVPRGGHDERARPGAAHAEARGRARRGDLRGGRAARRQARHVPAPALARVRAAQERAGRARRAGRAPHADRARRGRAAQPLLAHRPPPRGDAAVVRAPRRGVRVRRRAGGVERADAYAPPRRPVTGRRRLPARARPQPRGLPARAQRRGALRLPLRRRGARGARRARRTPRRGGARRAHDVQQQPRRRRADRRPAHARAARPGGGGVSPRRDPQKLLDAIAAEIREHVPCGFQICEQATNLVPGEGSATAAVMLVGEAPGAKEDESGRPFVGGAGKLLDRLLEEAGLQRDDVFITNVVKARPPGNRDPKADEVAHHLPWLEAQLEVIRPKLLVPLGRHALARFAPDTKITQAHGSVLERDGRTLFPMFHPAAALRNPKLRATLHEDAKALRAAL